MAGCEEINPYGGDGRAKGEQVREMFDHIAPTYDFLNRAMTMGIDKIWRAKAVKRLAPVRPRYLLDIASGTGDLAMILARRLQPLSVTGIDLSEKMLEVARRKIARAGLGDIISFEQADSLALPFTDREFDCVTVAYGVRNFENLLAGYREMHRVLRPGGLLAVLELSTPTNPVIRRLYDFYAGHIIPFMGRLISAETDAYRYLPRSIAAVPQGEEMASLMREAGFSEVEVRPMTFGVCTLYIAKV